MVALALFALNPLICSHDLKLSTSAKDIVGHSVWHKICWILDSWTPYGNWENTAYMWHKRINITSKQLFGTNGAFHYSSEVRWFEITADYVIKKTPPQSWSFSSDSPLPWPSQVPNSMLWKCCEMSTMYTCFCAFTCKLACNVPLYMQIQATKTNDNNREDHFSDLPSGTWS